MNFDGVTFTENAYFDGITFSPDLYFQRVKFRGAADFGRSTFDGEVNFEHAEFHRAADFGRSTFNGEVNFEHAEFHRAADFGRSTFNGEVNFDLAIFSSRASFRDVTLRADSDFNIVTFGVLADFGRSNGPGSLRLVDCVWPSQSVLVIGHARLEIHRLDARAPLTIRTDVGEAANNDEGNGESHSISLIESTLLHPVIITVGSRLTGSSFESTTGLDQLRFQGDPKWKVIRRRKMLYDEILGKPPEVLEHLYRQLRAGLEASGARPAAADFFYGEMEARRDRIPSPRFKSSEWWLLSIYNVSAGYGVRPWRSFVCYFGVVFSMGLMFYCGGDMVNKVPMERSFIESMIYSLQNSVNFLELGTSKLSSLGIGLVVFERLIALGLLALAVIGLRSRTER